MNAVQQDPNVIEATSKLNALSKKLHDNEAGIQRVTSEIRDHTPKEADVVDRVLAGDFQTTPSTYQQELTQLQFQQNAIKTAIKEQTERLEAARYAAEQRALAREAGPLIKQAGVIVELVAKLQAANDKMLELSKDLRKHGIQDAPALFFPLPNYRGDEGNEFLTLNLDNYLDSIDVLKRRVSPFIDKAA